MLPLRGRFAKGLSEAGFEILNEVVLNQVLVSFGTAEETQRVIAEVQQEGTCWCGPTVWQRRHAMRISVSSWMTTEEDVDRSLEAILRVGRKVNRVNLISCAGEPRVRERRGRGPASRR